MAIIDRIQTKVTRAKQHIQDFHLGLKAFSATGPYTYARKEDTEGGKRTYYIDKALPVPDALTAIAADVVHNLRSPLDQIAYQLVLDANGPSAEDWRVYFPISGNAASYPATRKGQIKGVRQEVIDAIDATEPYPGGKGHALWQLNALNNPDKHRIPLLAGAYFRDVDMAPLFQEFFADIADKLDPTPMLQRLLPGLRLRPKDKLFPLKEGDELFVEHFDPGKPTVAKQMGFTFDVSFNAPGVIEPEPALKTLHDMANLVEGVVGALGRFLPK